MSIQCNTRMQIEIWQLSIFGMCTLAPDVNMVFCPHCLHFRNMGNTHLPLLSLSYKKEPEMPHE